MSIDQEPRVITAEELALKDLVVLSEVVAVSHPKNTTSPTEALETIWRPDSDYGIGHLSDFKTTEGVAYAGSISYACNRFDDVNSVQIPGALGGTEIAADIIDFTERLSRVSPYRRINSLRQVRNELEVKRLQALGQKNEAIIAETVGAINTELSHHNKEVVFMAGAIVMTAGALFTWWRRRS